MKKLILILTISFVGFSLQAQEIWTLEKCVDYALTNNIQIKQQQLQVQSTKANVTQDKLNMLPNLNGFAMHGYNWGQTVDRYTNQFATQRVRTNNFYLSSSVTLFDGFQKLNRLRQSQTELEAANYDTDKFMDDISLSIATAYLQILYYKEVVKIAENQLEATNKQVDRVNKLVEAGAAAQGDLFTLRAQQAAENSQVISANNNLRIAYLTLTQMLDLPTTEGFEIEFPNLEPGSQSALVATPEQIYEYAIENQPDVKSSELRLKSSEYGYDQARGSLLPTLSLQGSIGTGYSGAALQLDSITPAGETPIGYFYPTPEVTQPVYSMKFDPVYKEKIFADQISDNINQSLSFNLSIPIFNGYASRTAISKAKINMETSKLSLETTKLNLRKTIQQAYADAHAAYNNYQSSLTGVAAAKESYRYAEQRFIIGSMNSVEYNNAKTNLEKSESELIQAKFNYIFKTTVLDFYMGKPITLNRK